MTQMYELQILVPLAKVATIIEVLAGEGTLLQRRGGSRQKASPQG